MTLLDKLTYLVRSGLAILLVPIFFACDDPTDLGLELDGEDNKLNTQRIEFILPASTISIDSLRTDHFNLSLVGQYSDSVFGTSRATSYNSYSLNAGVLPGDTLEFSNAFIRMRVFDVRTDYHLEDQTIHIHEAQDTIFSSAVYFADKSIPYDVDPIGTGTFNFNAVLDSVVSIPLADEFGEFLFNRLSQADSLSQGLYYYNPLVFVPEASTEGIFSFDLTNDTTAIYVEMKGELGDKYYYTFDFNNKHFTHIDRDRGGAKLSDLTTDYQATSNSPSMSYMDMVGGVYTKLSLQPLLDFIESNENVLVNKAYITQSTTAHPSRYIDNLGTIQHYFIKDNGRINGPGGNGARAGAFALLTENSYLSTSPTLLTTSYDTLNFRYRTEATLFSQILFDNFIDEDNYLTEELVILSSRTLSLSQTRFRNSDIKLTLFYTTLK